MRRWHSSESEEEDGIAGGTGSGKYGRITDGFVGWNFVIIRLITWNHKVNHGISGNYLGSYSTASFKTWTCDKTYHKKY